MSDNNLFVKAASDDEAWSKLMETLQPEDFQKIVEVSDAYMQVGYDADSVDDKMDFINKLPYECKRQWLEMIEKELDSAQESE